MTDWTKSVKNNFKNECLLDFLGTAILDFFEISFWLGIILSKTEEVAGEGENCFGVFFVFAVALVWTDSLAWFFWVAWVFAPFEIDWSLIFFADLLFLDFFVWFLVELSLFSLLLESLSKKMSTLGRGYSNKAKHNS